MSLFAFNTGTVAVVQSVMRAIIMTDEARRVYATELIDTYNGFGSKYIKAEITSSIKSNVIAAAMSKLITPFPILQTFINALSAVYIQQPKRSFSLEGKLIVDKIDEGMDKEKYHADSDLKKTLDKLYDREFCLRIKEAEAYTNLLSTVVYKINNREGKLRLDFVPNDVAVVAENIEDSTQMNRIYFMRGVGQNQEQNLSPIYESWTLDEFEILSGVKDIESIKKSNRAVEELRKYEEVVTGEDGAKETVDHIGSGFPPFVVLRSSLPLDGFWNIQDKDVCDVIKQICVALTEIRYLQRYGAFGLKYSVNAKLPEEAKMDITGFWEFQQDDPVPGTTTKEIKIDELENKAKIAEITQSVFDMLRLLFTLKGINSDALTGTKERSTAEAKQIDRKDLMEQITEQEEIWKLNEENIFKTLICVYNRDNSKPLPKGLTIDLDFPDAEEAAADLEKKLNNWLVMIQNHFKTPVDWIMDQNPDLNSVEAEMLYERNMEFNKKEDQPKEPELGPDGKPLVKGPGGENLPQPDKGINPDEV